MNLRDILEGIKRPLCTLPSNQTVDGAIREMAGQNIAALIITEGSRAVGIFTATDIVRAYVGDPAADLNRIPLRNAMTSKLITGHPDDSVTSAAAMMLRRKIRHLPVIAKDRILGMLTIGELMEHRLAMLDVELSDLKEYIAHLHDAAHD
jgi:CBS domain-containing protein